MIDDSRFGKIVVAKEYEELERNGKLREVLQLRIHLRKLKTELEKVNAELMRCEEYAWIDKFAMRLLAAHKPVYANLQRHFEDLENRSRKLVVETETIFDKIVNMGGSVVAFPEADSSQSGPKSPLPLIPSSGRNEKASARFRDYTIQRHRDLPNKELSRKLDFELPQGGDQPSLGIPEGWTEKYGVRTYAQAYQHPQCRKLFQKLISKAKQGL